MTAPGLYVPLVTPFDSAGALALPALRALAEDVLDAGAAGLVALGTTAEPGSLTAAEQRAVLDVVAGVCLERGAPLLVGASTAEAVVALGGRPGVSAALSLVPPFVRPGEAGVVAHFAALAAASPVPVVVYHVPYRSGQSLAAGALRTIAGLPGVVGIKYAAGSVDSTVVELLADPPADFAVLGGDDPFLSALLALGAHGGIAASALVAPAPFVELHEAWGAGDVGRARALGSRLAALSLALFAEPNPCVIKAVLHAQGRLPTALVRLPLLAAAPGSVRAVVRQLDVVGTGARSGSSSASSSSRNRSRSGSSRASLASPSATCPA